MLKTTQKIYIADFENNNKGEVIYWYLENISNPKNNYDGLDIFSFFDFLDEKNKKENIILYFHNLSYDAQFILTYLLKNGFVFSDTNSLKKYSFNSYISPMGQIYNIKIRLTNYIKIFDSKNIIDYSVEELSKNIKKYKKIKIDFDNIDFKKLKKRCQNDVKIIIYYLRPIIKKYGIVSTANKMSFNNFSKKTDFGIHKSFYAPKITKRTYNYLRRGYNGGLCYLNKKYQNKIIKKINVYDVNSMYPYIMRDNFLPFGLPEYFKGKYKKDDVYNIYIQHVKADFKIKQGKIPFIRDQRKGFFNLNYGMVEDTKNELYDLYLTERELKLFVKNYDITIIKFIDGFKFQSCNFFKKYIDKIYKDKVKYKKNKDKVNENISKIFLNTIYGSFGKKIEYYKKVPYIDKKGILQYRKDDLLIKTNGLYIPMAIFITSYARCKLIEDIQEDYNNFIYCDTDSIHTFGTMKNIDDYEIGKYKIESKNCIGKYIREKCYILKEKNKDLKVVVSGLTAYGKEQVNFENFRIGATYDNLRPERTESGVMLQKDKFKIY